MNIEINNIYHFDAIELLKNIDNKKVDLFLTDIPYEKVNKSSNGLRRLDKGRANTKTFELEKFLPEVDRVTSGSGYIFCGKEQVSEIFDYFNSAGYTTRLMVWEKTNPSPMNSKHVWMSGIETFIYFKKPGATFNENYKNCVMKYPNGNSNGHPTRKPLKLFEYLIKVSSNKGDIVCDPCVGSGTTAEAAIKNGRNFIVGDIYKKFCNLSKKRINKYDI